MFCAVILSRSQDIASMTNEELIQQARSVVNPRKIAHGFTVGDVGCALVTDRGNLHVGVCIDVGGLDSVLNIARSRP